MEEGNFFERHFTIIRAVASIFFVVMFICTLFLMVTTVFTTPTRWQDKSSLTLQEQGYTVCRIKESGKPLVTIAGVSDDELSKYNNQTSNTISVMKIRVNGEISEVMIPVDQIEKIEKYSGN